MNERRGSTKMARFNLICHGMMAHVEQDDTVLIAIPDVQGHVYKFGDPRNTDGTCDDSQLKDLPTGSFKLEVPNFSRPGIGLREMVSSCENVVLDQEKVGYKGGASREFLIPKPSL